MSSKKQPRRSKRAQGRYQPCKQFFHILLVFRKPLPGSFTDPLCTTNTATARITLDWPLDAQGSLPFFGRQAFHKEIVKKSPRIVNDDIWTFNSQSSSQWDGLRHFAYQQAERFYNNVTMDDIHGPNKTNVNGIGAWAEQGIVGRGVLLDYHAWRQATGVEIDKNEAFRTGGIPLADLKAVAEWEGVQFKFGDILIIRSGACTLLPGLRLLPQADCRIRLCSVCRGELTLK